MTALTDTAIVLLSGGQDSTTCLGWAMKRFERVHALTISYGQRHVTELEAARKIAEEFGIGQLQLEIPTLASLSDSALVTGREIKADGGYADDQAKNGLPTTFVPGRNLLFLSVAGAAAVKLGASNIVTGVCQTDYSGYPDCRRSFIDAMEETLSQAMPSSCGPFKIHTPLMDLTKAETVLMAYDMPDTWKALRLTVTCYEGERPGCGKCPACNLRAKGFEASGLTDPAVAVSNEKMSI